MNKRKMFLTVLVVSTLLLTAGCGSNPAPAAAPAQDNTQVAVNTEDVNVAVNESGVAVNTNDDAQPKSGLMVNTEGALIVVDGTPQNEVIAIGTTINYGENISVDFTQDGAETIVKYALSANTADTLISMHKEQPIRYDDLLVQTKGIEPLFNDEKDNSLKAGHGYYFVDNGKVLFVGFKEGYTTLVTYIGNYNGLTITVVESNVSVQLGENTGITTSANSSGNANVSTNSDGSVSVSGGGVSIEANSDSATVQGGGASVEANQDGAKVQGGGTSVEANSDGSANIEVEGGPNISVDESGNVDIGGLFG